MATIGQIKNRILETIKKGGDTVKLEQELKQKLLDEQAEEAAKAEVAKLKATAERQRGHESAAKAILAKVQTQGEAVEGFLEAKEITVKGIDDAMADIESMQEMQSKCFAQYSRADGFRDEASKVPQGYLPDGLTCPFLWHDTVPGDELVGVTLRFLKQAREIIAGAKRYDQTMPHQLKETEGLEQGSEG